MRAYLQLFRDQVFPGSFVLLKRIFWPGLLLTILLTILSLAIILPLMLQGLGWNISDLVHFKENFQEAMKTMDPNDNPLDVLKQFFGKINFLYLIICFILSMIFTSLQYVVYFRLNDNEIRKNNNSFIEAIAKSLNAGDIMKMLGAYILMVLLFAGVFMVYFIFVFLLYYVAAILGIIVGFLLLFVVGIFILRFSIIQAALIHGNMTISEAFAFSYKNITWKRGGILLLIGLVFLIAAMVIGLIIQTIGGLFFGNNNPGLTAYIVLQLFSNILGAIIALYFHSALSSIYFRYSNDELEGNDKFEEHLIN
ncbi:MAG: hypothetical protein V4613_09790 [Bacteroidota bacterium]